MLLDLLDAIVPLSSASRLYDVPPVSSVFTALHQMQTRSSDEKAVRLSVRPSVKRVNCDKTEKRSVQIFIQYERSFSLVF